MTLLLTVTIICSSTHVLLLHLLLAICCPILYSPRIFLLYWVEFVTLTHFGICSHSSGFLCQIFFSIVGVWDMSSQGSTCIFSFRLVHTLSLINVCSTELITLPRKITGTLSTKYAFKAKKTQIWFASRSCLLESWDFYLFFFLNGQKHVLRFISKIKEIYEKCYGRPEVGANTDKINGYVNMG